jgi:hypothetical protein
VDSSKLRHCCKRDPAPRRQRREPTPG